MKEGFFDWESEKGLRLLVFFLGFFFFVFAAAAATFAARLDGGEGDECETDDEEEEFVHTVDILSRYCGSSRGEGGGNF